MEINFKKVSYRDSIKKNPILTSINLSLEPGIIHGIVGPSGSGKTTLIEMINALVIPTEGYITVDDFRIEKGHKIHNVNELRFNVGLVFQNPEEQFFQKTVRKEIEFGMRMFEYQLQNIDKRVKDALKMVGLNESFLERNPFELSNGEKRKVAIASVLAFNPKVLILDEPTVGLDDRGKKNLVKLLRMLKERYKKTIIIVSHDVDLLYELVDNVVVVHNGKILASGTNREVFRNVKFLNKNGIGVPKLVEFIHLVAAKKKVLLNNYDDINDLIKAIYRSV